MTSNCFRNTDFPFKVIMSSNTFKLDIPNIKKFQLKWRWVFWLERFSQTQNLLAGEMHVWLYQNVWQCHVWLHACLTMNKIAYTNAWQSKGKKTYSNASLKSPQCLSLRLKYICIYYIYISASTDGNLHALLIRTPYTV